MLRWRLSFFEIERGKLVNLKLRNHLSEILLKGLQGKDQMDILRFLSIYCRTAKIRKTTRITLKEISLPIEQVLSDLSDFGVFSVQGVHGAKADTQIDLLPQFQQDLDYLCARITAYQLVFSEAGEISEASKDLDWAIKLGVLLFNQGLYFECHEFLEGFWREEKATTKEFLQGIISLATALYHLERGNRPSAIKLFADGCRRLQAFGKTHRGLAIGPLLEQIEKIQTLVEEGSQVALEQLKRMPLPKVEFKKN